MKMRLSLALLPVSFVLACPTEEEPPPPGIEPVCEEPTEPPCRDETLASIDVNPTAVGEGAITNTADGDGYETHVDAVAGGMNGTGAYVYGRFTDDGLEKVEVTDDDSFGSMDWDIGVRRFVVRLNSGDGGPSCVGAANLGTSQGFDEVDGVPEGAEFQTEEFMNASCELVPDGSGLETAPGVLLQNFWDYTAENCLGMTGNVYIVQLASGRHLKLEVTQYYDPPEAQQACQDGEYGDFSGTKESGNVHLRWAFLDG